MSTTEPRSQHWNQVFSQLEAKYASLPEGDIAARRQNVSVYESVIEAEKSGEVEQCPAIALAKQLKELKSDFDAPSERRQAMTEAIVHAIRKRYTLPKSNHHFAKVSRLAEEFGFPALVEAVQGILRHAPGNKDIVSVWGILRQRLKDLTSTDA